MAKYRRIRGRRQEHGRIGALGELHCNMRNKLRVLLPHLPLRPASGTHVLPLWRTNVQVEANAPSPSFPHPLVQSKKVASASTRSVEAFAWTTSLHGQALLPWSASSSEFVQRASARRPQRGRAQGAGRQKGAQSLRRCGAPCRRTTALQQGAPPRRCRLSSLFVVPFCGALHLLAFHLLDFQLRYTYVVCVCAQTQFHVLIVLIYCI